MRLLRWKIPETLQRTFGYFAAACTLLAHAASAGTPLEFNYFTRFNPDNAVAPEFLAGQQFNAWYKKEFKDEGRVFSFFNPKGSPNPLAKNYTSLYLNKDPALTSLTSINDFISQASDPPLMRDSLPKILSGEVPDHADIAASKPSNSRLLDLLSTRRKLVGEGDYDGPDDGTDLSFHRQFLYDLSERGQDQVCLLSAHKVFCKGEEGAGPLQLDDSPDSVLHIAYKLWYGDMKKLAKIDAMIADVMWMQWLENQPKHLALVAINESLLRITEAQGKLASPERLSNEKIDEMFGIFKISDWAHDDQQIHDIRTALISMATTDNPGVMPMITGHVEEYILAQRKKYLEEIKPKIEALPSGANVETPADCPSPPQALGLLGGSQKVDGAYSSGVTQCGNIALPPSPPESFTELARFIPYYPKKDDVLSNEKHEKIKLTPGWRLSGIEHLTRRSNRMVSKMNSAEYGTRVWECLAEKISSSWSNACVASKYVPFRILFGYRKEKTPNIDKGVSLHDLGLAIDIDPSLNGNGDDWTNSVFTNAWLKKTVQHEEIDSLGVYAEKAEDLLDNVYEDIIRGSIPVISGLFSAAAWLYRGDKFRRSHQYDDAFGVYEEDLGTYLKSGHKDNIICPINSNPLLWVLVFCESSGMRWGNSTFMRKRYRGGNDWTPAEKLKLDEVFGIKNVVDRVRAISWNTTDVNNDHMHFQYWGGNRFITWEEIAEAARLNGVVYNL